MNSLILGTVTRFITPFLFVLSIFLLLRGHNEPGGGFVGGLVAASALAVHMMAFGEKAMRAVLRVDPRTLAGVGLVIAVLSGFPGLFLGQPFLTSQWFDLWTPLGTTKIGTPLFFDVGVYFVVVGVTVSFVEDMNVE